MDYNTEEHFATALTFASLFFVIFYVTFLAYKLIRKEPFETWDILLLLANCFIFYGIGYTVIDGHETGSQLLGLFTLCNAILHFVVSVIIYRLKLADKNLFYLISGLVLVFVTITIPVQLDGNWVTLLWIGEAALLFWIGRSKSIPVYENLSYPLMLMALFSLYQDWDHGYMTAWYTEDSYKITPLLNSYFLSTLLVTAVFGFIYFINNKSFAVSNNGSKKDILSYAIPTAIISTIYVGIFLEINHYFESLYKASELIIKDEYYNQYYNNYSLLK